MIDDNFEIVIMMITLIDDDDDDEDEDEEEEEEDWWQMLNDTQETCGCTLSLLFRFQGSQAAQRCGWRVKKESNVIKLSCGRYYHGMIWHVNVRRNKLNLMTFSENDMM